MDCRTAKDILNVVRPGAVDQADADVSAAVAHLEDCDDCLLALRWHQALDRRIGRAMRDAPVPYGLKERLQQALAEAAGGVPQAADEHVAIAAGERPPAGSVQTRVSAVHSSRRWVRFAAAAAALVLLMAAVWFVNQDRGPRSTLAHVYSEVPLTSESFEPFDGGFEPVLPTGGWLSRVAVDPKPSGSNLGLGGEHVVALYRFRFRGRDGAAIEGLLAVAPAGSIAADRPLPSSFEAADADYLGRRTPDGRQLGARAWSSDGFVYVCIVPADRLDELGQLLDLPIG